MECGFWIHALDSECYRLLIEKFEILIDTDCTYFTANHVDEVEENDSFGFIAGCEEYETNQANWEKQTFKYALMNGFESVVGRYTMQDIASIASSYAGV